MEVLCPVKKRLKLSGHSVALERMWSMPIQFELSFLRSIENHRLDLLSDFGGPGPG